MKKDEVLDEAKRLIMNDRPKHYGTPKENFTRIAKIWSIILEKDITPVQVALCMVGVKMTRLIQTGNHTDSFIDLAGYAACGAECVDDPMQNLVDETEKLNLYEKPLPSVSQWGLHG